MLVLSALLREGPLYSRTLSGASYYVVKLFRYVVGRVGPARIDVRLTSFSSETVSNSIRGD